MILFWHDVASEELLLSDRIKLQLDGNKLLHHLDVVDQWIKGENIYPVYIAFSPSSYCNHSCVFCVYQHKKFEPIYFPLIRYKELVEEWGDIGVKSVFFAGDGDPLLNKNCVEMAQYTRQKGIDIAINTNGRLLDQRKIEILSESLEWIRFSVNAGTEKTYAHVHGTHERDFEIVLKNIENLVKEKHRRNSKITIGIQCVLLKENLQEIGTLARRVKDIGVDYLAVKPFLKHPLIEYKSEIKDIDAALLGLKKISTLSDSKFNFVLRENLFRETQKRSYCNCLSGPFMIEIDAKGDVYNCGPYLGNPDHRYGSVMNQSFREMWESERKRSVMKNIEEKVNVAKCMPFCRPDSVNRFLWEIRNPPEHVNYI